LSALPVVQLSELPPKSHRTVVIEGKKVALFRLDDGQIFALDDTCPDQGYTLGTGGCLEGDIVTCGFHFWQFNVRTGRSADGMDEQLATYQVTIEGDQVLVDVHQSAGIEV
jgi:nitrite reductase/ring-hydroxylating ferredoxin subunit